MLLLTSTGFLVILWNLATLTFAEYLDGAKDVVPAPYMSGMSSQIMKYRWTGVQSIASMISGLGTLSSDEASIHETGISSDIPYFSCHITSHLVLQTLVKAIDSAVGLRSPGGFLHGPSLGFGIDTDPYVIWSGCVKSMLRSLISLEATVWGSHTAREALQGLMQRHGDILTECWSVDPCTKSDGLPRNDETVLSF